MTRPVALSVIALLAVDTLLAANSAATIGVNHTQTSVTCDVTRPNGRGTVRQREPWDYLYGNDGLAIDLPGVQLEFRPATASYRRVLVSPPCRKTPPSSLGRVDRVGC